MLIAGDVLAIVAAIVGGGASAWALIVACGLLFPDRSKSAYDSLSASPTKAFWRGVLLTVTLGTLSIVIANLPAPALKILGVGMVLGLFLLAMLGCAGVSLLAAERISANSNDMQRYPAFVRGSAFLVAGTMFPAIGWFLFGPALFFVGLGTGWTAMWELRHSRSPVHADVVSEQAL